MTEKDIERVQIIATLKDGQHILAVSENSLLIRCIVSLCQFATLKKELFEQCSLRELMED